MALDFDDVVTVNVPYLRNGVYFLCRLLILTQKKNMDTNGVVTSGLFYFVGTNQPQHCNLL